LAKSCKKNISLVIIYSSYEKLSEMDIRKYSKPFSYNGNKDIGILVIHGFTATTYSMQYLADKFAEAGFYVELPLLAGHGTKWQDLNKVHYQDWIKELDKSLLKLKGKVTKIFVIGLSMGGTLALYLAETYPELKGIIIINNACLFKNPSLIFLPVIKLIVSSVKPISSDLKDPNCKEIAYNRTPTKGLHELFKLIKIMKKNLFKITQPILIFKSKEDNIIPVKSATYVYDRINSKNKDFIWLENSYHVATMDFDKDIIVEKSISFIEKNSTF